MKVILSADSLSAVRHTLATFAPGAKRSHLAEAVAAACGYSTNAALQAALQNTPLDTVLIAEFEPQAGASRLSEMSGAAAVGPDHFFEAVIRARAGVLNPSYDELIETAIPTYQDRGWNALSRPEAVAYQIFRFHWRMTKGWVGVVDYLDAVDDDVTQTPTAYHLAGIFHLMRDHDREMADFLVEYLLSAHGYPDQETRQEASRWGDFIYWGYQNRIRRLIDTICRCWPHDEEPQLVLAPKMLPSLSDERVPDVVPGRSQRRSEIGLMDTGYPTVTLEAIVGIVAMSGARAGYDLVKVGQEADAVMRSGREAPRLAAAGLAKFGVRSIDWLPSAVGRGPDFEGGLLPAGSTAFDPNKTAIVFADTAEAMKPVLEALDPQYIGRPGWAIPANGASDAEIARFADILTSALRMGPESILWFQSSGHRSDRVCFDKIAMAARHGFMVAIAGLPAEERQELEQLMLLSGEGLDVVDLAAVQSPGRAN